MLRKIDGIRDDVKVFDHQLFGYACVEHCVDVRVYVGKQFARRSESVNDVIRQTGLGKPFQSFLGQSEGKTPAFKEVSFFHGASGGKVDNAASAQRADLIL